MSRVAILGGGRSGVASAKAVLKLGGNPTIFDAKAEDDPSLASARELDVDLVGGFTGDLPGGFDQLVVSPGVASDNVTILSALRQSVEVIGEIELAYRVSEAPVVAITGTNGKSTTTVMAWQCLRAAGVDAILCGNIYGSGYAEIPMTEAALAARSDQVLVAEVSSFQLEWVSRFRPIAAGITNITEDHLSRHGTFGAYVEAKRRIYSAMGGKDVGVSRSGDALTAPVDILNWTFDGGDAWFDGERIHVGEISVPLADLPFREPHNILNAQMALLLAKAALQRKGREGEFSKCFDGLREFKGLAHRMEWIGEARGIAFVNNSMCTNPAAVVASSLGHGRPQRILIGGRNKGMDLKPLADFLNATSHTAYLYGETATEVSRLLTAPHSVSKDMREAFQRATAEALPGETILLAPGFASQDGFDDFRQRGDVFRALAKEWLCD